MAKGQSRIELDDFRRPDQGRPVAGISQCHGDTFRPERSLAAHEGKRRTLGTCGAASGRTSAGCPAYLQAPEPHPPGRPGGFGAKRGTAWRRGFASAGSSVRRVARVSGSTWLDATASGHARQRPCSRDGGACLGALSVRCNTGNRFVQPVTVSNGWLGTAVLWTRRHGQYVSAPDLGNRLPGSDPFSGTETGCDRGLP